MHPFKVQWTLTSQEYWALEFNCPTFMCQWFILASKIIVYIFSGLAINIFSHYCDGSLLRMFENAVLNDCLSSEVWYIIPDRFFFSPPDSLHLTHVSAQYHFHQRHIHIAWHITHNFMSQQLFAAYEHVVSTLTLQLYLIQTQQCITVITSLPL